MTPGSKSVVVIRVKGCPFLYNGIALQRVPWLECPMLLGRETAGMTVVNHDIGLLP